MHAEREAHEQAEQAEGQTQTAPVPVPEFPHKKRRLAAWAVGAAGGLLLYACAIAFSLLCGWIGSGSVLKSDLVYHLLKNVVGYTAEQAAYFTEDLRLGIWSLLLHTHGGVYEGMLTQTPGDAVSTWMVKVPFVTFSLILQAGLIACLRVFQRLPYVKERQGDAQKAIQLVVCAFVYAVLVTATLMLSAPSSTYTLGTAAYKLRLSVSFWDAGWKSFVLAAVAGLIGYGPWALLRTNKLTEWLKGFKKFAIMLGAFYALVMALTVTSWVVSERTNLQNSDMLTMGSIWSQYRTDPLTYVLLPDILLREQLYSLGANWHVSGQDMAHLLDAKYPFTLNAITGVSIQPGAQASVQKGQPAAPEQEKWGRSLESALQFSWFNAALLLVFLFALAQLAIRKAGTYLISAGLVTGLFTLFAEWSSIRLWKSNAGGDGSLVAAGWIGFEWSNVLTAFSVVAFVFLGASFAVQSFMQRSVKGADITHGR
ncbi:hypothetical protein [Paenibacillus sp. MBLB4367]|uniref:hypothetical protein n=1 Tax=Paenibacillus sp. MBLB4367 TaxID=3384767 RepID=UPI00390804F1